MSSLSPLPPQLPRKSLGSQVYDSIREAIVSLKLEPGQMIYENELAETLGVSRTPIREAIRLLVGEELLDVLPQKGTRIAYISERKVTETRFIREQLEQGAFRIAARVWQAEVHRTQKEAIVQLLEEQRAAAAREDITEFLRLDEAFHRMLLELTGNSTLLNVIYHMRAHLNRLRYLALKQFHDMHRVLAEHEQLFAAIESKDETATVRLLEQHFGQLNTELPSLREAFSHYFTD
ncbi:GntR family transcriptional regulator [Paenibacillus koleovorans]|uniref:GntR family transcriptional regulator n=1 Tax=Paenibacillus koleovorans TaxID=121608 RepID=UPI000FD7C65D|nr:GntR family transcriptional regulator [Paenibacillus koleovorans]